MKEQESAPKTTRCLSQNGQVDSQAGLHLPADSQPATLPRMLPLEPSNDPDIRITQLENALEWTMDMLSELGVGYMPGDALLARKWKQ